MAIENLFDSASSVMTVVSFTTFAGILWWTFRRSNRDFDAAANLPFADEALDYPAEAVEAQEERKHG